MTREEFITGYCRRSDISQHQTETGFRIPIEGETDWVGQAVPCDCGEECCDGWVMIPPSRVSPVTGREKTAAEEYKDFEDYRTAHSGASPSTREEFEAWLAHAPRLIHRS